MEEKGMEKEPKKRKKKHIVLKIFGTILLIILLVIGFLFIKSKLNAIHAEKIGKTVQKINKDKIDYVFVEINPSFVLLVKSDKVTDVACLNEDCMSFYDEIDIKGKSPIEGIDALYDISKNKGFKVDDGVKVKTTLDLQVEDKTYIKSEVIDEKAKDELLKNLKNNKEIAESNNDDYYSKLWEELKKDSDYGKVYSCDMKDKKLECYISFETGINNDSDYNAKDEQEYNKLQLIFGSSLEKVKNTLKKFNFDVRDNKFYINGREYGYTPLFTSNNVPYKHALTHEVIEPLDDDICARGLVTYRDGKCEVFDGFYIIPLGKLDLVNPNVDSIIIKTASGMKESVLQNYQAIKELEG